MKVEQKLQSGEFILQALHLEEYNDSTVRVLMKSYTAARKDTEKAIKVAIAKNQNIKTKKRLVALLDNIEETLEAMAERLSKPTADAIGVAGEFSYKDTNRILSWDGNVKEYDNVSIPASKISAMVSSDKLGDKTMGGWLWGALDANQGVLREDINAKLIQGVGYRAIVDSLWDDYKGVIDNSKSDLETVVKTYTQAVNAKAHREIYAANKQVISKYEWSAIMENADTKTGRGTCPRCMALDGQQYDKETDAPDCPLHARCRCQVLPVTKTWRELGIDIDEAKPIETKWNERWLDYENGQIYPTSKSPWPRHPLDYGITGKSYPDYWLSKPKDWQVRAIGPNRTKWVNEAKTKEDKKRRFGNLVDSEGNLILIKYL